MGPAPNWMAAGAAEASWPPRLAAAEAGNGQKGLTRPTTAQEDKEWVSLQPKYSAIITAQPEWKSFISNQSSAMTTILSPFENATF